MQRIEEVGGLFIAGNPSTNTKGTIVTAAWLNAVQEELAHIVEATGEELSAADNTQALNAILALKGSKVFIASGSFTVPVHVTSISLTGCGGGGGGGAYNGANGAGGGGGGASCFKRTVAVTPGAVITVTIGSGGPGGSVAGGAGSAGGTTSFGALLSLAGGYGGLSVSNGGGGGSVSGGSGGIATNGGVGEQYNPRGSVSGGMGGSSVFGVGGFGGGTGTSNQAGAPASGYGSGGGGGASAGGGAGAPGFLIVEW